MTSGLIGGSVSPVHRLNLGRSFSFNQHLDFLFRLFEGLLTRAGQDNAPFKGLERLFEAEIAFFHPFDERLELIQGLFEIGDGLFLHQEFFTAMDNLPKPWKVTLKGRGGSNKFRSSVGNKRLSCQAMVLTIA